MKKIPLLALACTLLCSCGQNENKNSTEVPAPVLAKDTEARDLKGKVKSFITVSWQSPSPAEMSISFDSLYAKVGKQIAKYAKSGPSFTISEADAKEANRAHIQKDAFDPNGNMVMLAQYKKSWRPRRAIRNTDTVMFYDTALDGSIIYHDTTILNKDRSINCIVDQFTSVTDSILFVKTTLVRKNILRNDSAIVWVQTTTVSGYVPEAIPPASDTVTYKILEKDHQGNLLKVLVSHTDKQQPKELIMYKYTYYE